MIDECGGRDHRLDTYAVRDRRLLALVESFNHRLMDAAAKGADLTAVLAALDPDPARYTDVGEGGGIVEEVLAEAEAELAVAACLPGYRSLPSLKVPARAPSTRPAAAVAPDGTVLLAWIEWDEHLGERVVAQRLDGQLRPASEAVTVSGEPGDCLRPSVVFDGEGRGHVFFGLRRHGEVAVFSAREHGGGFSEPEVLSDTAHPSFNQEVVCHLDGSLECCWQGYAGGRFHVFSKRQQRDGVWSPTATLSGDGESNVWDPAVAVDGAGRTFYAWTTYGRAGYETALAVRQVNGDLRPQVLSEPGAYALHPSLAVAGDGSLFVAHDVVALGGHGGSGPTRLVRRSELSPERPTSTRHDGVAIPGDLVPEVRATVEVRRLAEIGAAPEPTGAVGTGRHLSPAGLPRLAFSGDGSLAVAYRCLRRLPLMLYFWEAVLEWHGPAGWESPTGFGEADGPLEEPALAAMPGGVLACWQTDGRKERTLSWTEGFGGEECLALREHYGEVVWHSLHTGGRIAYSAAPAPERAGAPEPEQARAEDKPAAAAARAGAPAQATAAAPPAGAPEPSSESRPWAFPALPRRSDRYRAEIGSRRYELYWGDLHRHSLVSRCTAGDEPELDDFYRYSFDVCEYDFWAVTDHAENTSPYQWWAAQKLADVLLVEGRFVPFYGFEWTAATGHQNVIYESSERGAPIYSSTAEQTRTPDQLWARLRRAGQRAVTIPHHPGSAMVPFDWDYGDEEMLRIVEIFQACRGNYEADGCFRQYSDGTLLGTFVSDGLERGHRFGLIASSDHGNGASYVGAFAEGLSRASIFDALYARRTIAATTRDVLVDFRLNEAFMGEAAAPARRASISATARGYAEIARLDVVRNGSVSHSVAPEVPAGTGEIVVALRVEWWAGEKGATDWSGHLEIDEGAVVETEFCSPGITSLGRHEVSWSAETRNFNSQYGSQRGGVELTLVGPPSARVLVETAPISGSTTLADLQHNEVVEMGRGERGGLLLKKATGGLLSLGTTEISESFEEEVTAPSWYYARAILVDGEMAWSSPIWIDPA